METKRIFYQTALLLFMLIFLCSCFNLNIIKNVKNPDKYFRKAHRQIKEIHKKYPRRNGQAHTLHVWIYDGKGRKLIRASAPILIVNHVMDSGVDTDRVNQEFDFEEKYDIDWDGIKDLDQFGPGLLFELDDEKSRILIWLE